MNSAFRPHANRHLFTRSRRQFIQAERMGFPGPTYNPTLHGFCPAHRHRLAAD